MDLKLSQQVKRACHALAIDDERHTFHPVIWDEGGESDGRIEQVWFAGVHSNVGGGYEKQGMSLVTLDWMMTQAEQMGLRFQPREHELYRERQNVNDKLYNSRAGLGVYYRYKPRDIQAICAKHHTRPKLHVSALKRIALGTEGYAPGNFPMTDGVTVVDTEQADHSEVSEALHRAFNGKTALLARASVWICVRRYSHYALLVVMAVALYLTWSFKSAQTGAADTAVAFVSGGGLMQLLQDFLLQPWAVAVLIILVAFFAFGWWATQKTKRIFTEAWYELVPHVRKALYGDGESGSAQ
jgi:hypothetical protein